MNAVFLGMAFLLTAAAGYWTLGRGTPRPTGTLAMGTLFGSFALAFASYSPLFEDTVEAVVPHVARLLSNCASVAAAASVLAISSQLNLEPTEARQRVRLRILLAAATAFGMTLLFAYEQMPHRSPQVYALYLLLFISYLGFATVGFFRQALRQSRSAHRGSVRFGLRLAAVGCAFALLYTAYKLMILVSLGLGYHLVPDHAQCLSLISTSCVFNATSPALAVLLICVGLTLPAVIYPVAQARRHRWEIRSLDALSPLWQELSAAMPEIVLPTAHVDKDTAADADFLLQRRVIEISDGILALRPYRSQKVLEAVELNTDVDAEERAAIIEAAVVRAALAAMKAGHPAEEVAEPSAEAASRKDLLADTQWFLRVADAYTRGAECVADNDQPGPVGASRHWSP